MIGQFVLPLEVDGWLAAEEGLALAELARGKTVLEIGSYCGRSTICMAQTAKYVVALDPHDGRGTPKPRNTLSELIGNLRRYGVADKVGVVTGTTAELVSALPVLGKVRQFDFIFIDGAHDKPSVQADLDAGLKVLAPDGLIAFHDYRDKPGQYDKHWDPGVNAVVNAQLKSGAKMVSRHMTIAVIKPVRVQLPDGPTLTVHRPGVTTA